MPKLEPTVVQMTAYQAQSIQKLDLEVQAAMQRRSLAIEMIVAGRIDPQSLIGWSIGVDGNAIILTPPDIAPAVIPEKDVLPPPSDIHNE